jgi:FkbM family methyltransferase
MAPIRADLIRQRRTGPRRSGLLFVNAPAMHPLRRLALRLLRACCLVVPLRQPFRRMVQIGLSRLPGWLADAPVDAVVPLRGTDLRFLVASLRDEVQRIVFFTGVHEMVETRLVRSLLGPGQCFLDVGAHVGYYSLLGAWLVGESGRVVAVEPAPANLRHLRRNLDLNGLRNVTVVPLAATARRGPVGFAAAGEAQTPHAHLDETGSLLVPGDALDAVLPAYGVARVDFAKFDIEGAEPEALAGAQRTLRDTLVGPLLIEFNAPRLAARRARPSSIEAQLPHPRWVDTTARHMPAWPDAPLHMRVYEPHA